jgi:hypothetical protein
VLIKNQTFTNIDEYFEMFEKFLSKYKVIEIQSMNQYSNNLKLITECKLPSGEEKWDIKEKYYKS